MNTCRTCLFWNRKQDWAANECQNSKLQPCDALFNEPQPGSVVACLNAGFGVPIRIYPEPDFGCIHHRERP